ncbi:hypothetical protein TCAL_02369 [Tigriopus californicus]|uniref:Uncharacterized protein n=1 Tax=Tigriopus californicus TaxID=6832 RepID=A0A553NYI9_TIGCA|nr:cytochrome c oxidase subunit NDUFA4-like [Tigriopus californicus]TRY70503.1 hypothetical protein TCAL_02369 [Tigriopus californicus]|eukprot:TCALIF_02369-PA protein Name:"Similar to Ndufa4 NADH dehydrogenase [ubiquinone] 1 alpha subcomplex subunit 4 (Mus musculus)" AED:0.00 eAED:0.00 QI:167/1/1/1/0/0.5/2/234/112
MRLTRLLRSVPKGYMPGEGGRAEMNSKLPQGLTKESLKHHYALWPLMGIMGAGMTFVAWYVIRLATTSPEVSWSKKPEIYNEYHNKRYKFLNPYGLDYEKMNNEIPDYKKDA